ncbi:hypothetical protein JCM18750_37260 [Halostagnicola bangensis]
MRFESISIELFRLDIFLNAVSRSLRRHSAIIDNDEYVDIACPVGVAASDTPEQHDRCMIADTVYKPVPNSSHWVMELGLRNCGNRIITANESLRVDLYGI